MAKINYPSSKTTGFEYRTTLQLTKIPQPGWRFAYYWEAGLESDPSDMRWWAIYFTPKDQRVNILCTEIVERRVVSEWEQM